MKTHPTNAVPIALALVALALNLIQQAKADSWSTVAIMKSARENHTATLLPNGLVLVVGGYGASVLFSAEFYDPTTGRWRTTSPLNVQRQFHTATLLPNGKVLVAGGETRTGIGIFATNGAELYDPTTGTWAATGALDVPRYDHTATLLPNGKVLVAGGFGGNTTGSAEIYDLATQTWTLTGTMTTNRVFHTATLLPSGKVLVAGGINGYYGSIALTNSAELYDPATGMWTATGSLNVPRYGHTATLLPNGKVLVAGGSVGGDRPTNSAELYNPTDGGWTSTGALAAVREYHTATLLPNGKVLVGGGQGTNSGNVLASAELYDSASGTWAAGASLAASRDHQTATLLPNGQVLAAGGYGDFSVTSSAELYDSTSGTFVATGSMPTGGDTATLLPNGKVLVAGGGTNTAELYDPATQIWAMTGTMTAVREYHSATLLPNGNVMVVGGYIGGIINDPGSYTSSAELYNPSNGTWTGTGAMTTPRSSHTATLLPNGKVLVAGGYNGVGGLFGRGAIMGAELYDPVAGTWTATGSMTTARYSHTATLLPNGKVLVAGGASDRVSQFSSPTVLSSAELYDPATGTWATMDTLYSPRAGHTATLLPNGEVLVAGGYNGSYLSSAELYDPTASLWMPTGAMIAAREFHRATLLPNGKVLVAGGTGVGGTNLSSAEVYNPVTGTWTATGGLNTARSSHTATLLPSGKVLVAGGSVTNAAELYDTGLGFSTAWQPQIATNTWALASGGNLALSGSGFRGISEGSGGNGSQDSPADFPVVQLRGIESGQTLPLLCTSWSTNGFVSAAVNHFLSGYALATVFVNGIPSSSAFVLKAQAIASVTLNSLSQTYDGSAKYSSATTVPPGLAVILTYNGSANAPTNVGSYTVIATVTDPDYQGVATNTLVIQKATATVTLGSLSQTYDGTAKTVSATTTPPGLTVNVTYNGSASAPTNAGNYTVIATVNDPIYQGFAVGTLVIAKAAGAVTLGNLSQTYDGTARSVTAATAPPGLAVSFIYSGSGYSGSVNAPTNAGSYTVVGTISDSNYQGSAVNTLVIGKATASVTLGNLSQTYDGTAKTATVATAPPGLAVTITYNGSANAPTSAGNYTVVGTITDPNYQGSAAGALVIGVASATVTLSKLIQTYDGTAKSVSVTTTPSGLSVSVTYNGSPNAPTNPASYIVIGTLTDPNYQGSATNTLLIGSTNNSLLVGAFPGPVPDRSGSLRVTLLPGGIGGQWRFPWELSWHNGGDLVTNLARDDYPVVFRQLPGYVIPPLQQPVAVQTNTVTTEVTNQYVPSDTGGAGLGWLRVDLAPNTVPNPGWRLLGEPSFHASGSTVPNLAPGTYVIEFSAVTNWAAPPRRQVPVFAGEGTEPLPIYYEFAADLPANVALPSPLANFSVINSSLTNTPRLPYAFNGQLQSDVGLASGVAVRSNVVLTAAHVVFNDETLSYASTVYWFFQEDAGEFDPKPLTARGWNVLSGYASTRTNDLTVLTNLYSPGVSSPESRNWDVAALYFDSPVARGGYGGYLSSDAATNEWLTSSQPKMLVGYPVDGGSFGDPAIAPGKMHATAATNYSFTLQTNRVYASADFLSFPGNSGGPVYVMYADNIYYPAGVYLGSMGNLSLVRAIDSNVVNLINRSSDLGDQGTNFTGGGVITIVASQTVNAGNPGYVQVRLGPSAAVAAGAGWRRQGDTGQFNTNVNATIAVTSSNGFTLEFRTNVTGWNPPPSRVLQVAPQVVVTADGSYTVIPPLLVVKSGIGIGMIGTANTVYRLERRSSLTGGNWVPAKTNTITNGFNLLLPWPLTNGSASFYRAVWLP